MNGRICFAAFSKAGVDLARKIAMGAEGDIWAPPRICSPGIRAIEEPLCDWAGKMIQLYVALVFVSACGIAVRAVAPHLRGKGKDPAVVVLDELGRHVISMLGGHLGGANSLAKSIADSVGGEAIITTATDVNGVPAVDEWARAHNCAVENIAAAKYISAAALEGAAIGVAVTEELHDAPWPVTLWLRPKNLVLGVGCKKGVSFAKIKEAFRDFLDGCGVSALSVAFVASVDIKKAEEGLLELAKWLDAPLETFTAKELKKVPGTFAGSEKVESAVGVDNVCERAAVLKSGGCLLRGKTRYDGITFALAKMRRE